MPETVGRCVEFGSRDINGGLRDLLPAGATYVGVDVQDGPGVDVVADGATFVPESLPDLVLCTEVFEHLETWRDVVANAHEILGSGGTFIATAAGPGRAPHSARRESVPDADEWYRNVTWEALQDALKAAGFVDGTVEQNGTDVRCVARKAV